MCNLRLITTHMKRKSIITPQTDTVVLMDTWLKKCIVLKAEREGSSLSSFIEKLVAEDYVLTIDEGMPNVNTFTNSDSLDPDDEVFKPLEEITWIIDLHEEEYKSRTLVNNE